MYAACLCMYIYILQILYYSAISILCTYAISWRVMSSSSMGGKSFFWPTTTATEAVECQVQHTKCGKLQVAWLSGHQNAIRYTALDSCVTYTPCELKQKVEL